MEPIKIRSGRSVVCSSFEQIQWWIQRHPQQKTRVIVLDDNLINVNGYICGSILLPNLSISSILIDNNDVNGFAYSYTNYLTQDPEVVNFISLLQRALLDGINVIFFTNDSPIEMFLNVLLQVLNTSYGMTVTPFEANADLPGIINQSLPNFWNLFMSALDRMLMFEYITPEYYGKFFRYDGPFKKLSVEIS